MFVEFGALRKEICKKLPQTRDAMVTAINDAFTKLSRNCEFINRCILSIYERMEECAAHSGRLFEPYRK